MKQVCKHSLSRRIIAMLLVVMAMASVVCVSAFAANDDDGTKDSHFNNFTVKGSATSYTAFNSDDARIKHNDSAMYLYITGATQESYYVRALGSSSKKGSYGNYTCVNARYVDHVTCKRYTQYEVHSFIFEDVIRPDNVNPYAKFSFASPYSVSSWITGAWSPDCGGNYTDATT